MGRGRRAFAAAFAVCLAVAWCGIAQGEEIVTLKAELSPERPRVGETISYICQLTWSGSPQRIRIDRPDDIRARGMAFVGASHSVATRTTSEGPQTFYTLTFRFEAIAEGEGGVPEFPIPFTLADTGDALSIEAPEKTLTIYAAPQPFPWQKLLTGLGAAGGIVFVAIGTLFAVRWQRERASRQPPPHPSLAALRSVRSVARQMDSRQAIPYFEQIHYILKEWLRQRHALETHGAVAEELAAKLQETDISGKEKLIAVLNEIQQVRFGGHRPSAFRSREVLEDLEEILRADLPDGVEDDEPAPDLSEHTP